MSGAAGKKIWVFAFEFAGIAKVGGLGEVSANQCRSLANDPEIQLRVFLPSHGRHEMLKSNLNLAPLVQPNGKVLRLKGHMDFAYFLNGLPAGLQQKDLTYFEVELWEGKFEAVPVYLLVGITPLAAYVLNDPEVYSRSTLNAKLGLYAQTMKEFMRFCIFTDPRRTPEIIHIHDHHPVPALINCRQQLLLAGQDVATIITMHLLTWPRRDIDFYWKCGINNEKMGVFIGKFQTRVNFREIFQMCKTDWQMSPTLEQIGCAIADKVIAVSRSFLHSDIIPNCGGNIIQWKSDFTWNGCDWEFQELVRDVISRFGEDLTGMGVTAEKPLRSWMLRKLFLTDKIALKNESSPKISDKDIKAFIAEEFQEKPYHSDGKVDAFEEDGPLVLVTGRVSPQKGIETLLASIPAIINHIPTVKFVFLMVPSSYTLPDLANYMGVARKYPKNVRFLFGIAGSIYTLAHLSADIYCCPSRWEPFGIVALEAMASKIPVVASVAGGLKESIVSLDGDLEKGTGLLVAINDSTTLTHALVSLLAVMAITEKTTRGIPLPEAAETSLLSKIVYPGIRQKIQEDPLFGNQIRENAYRRVTEVFRWKTVSQKLKRLYLGLS